MKTHSLAMTCLVGLMVHSTMASGTAEWREVMSASRPYVPIKTMPARACQTLANATWVQSAAATVAEKLPFAIPADAVWTQRVTTATEELYECRMSLADGSMHSFAVYGQYGNLVPYFWTGSGYAIRAFNSDEDAIAVTTNFVASVICGGKDGFEFAWSAQVFNRSEVIIRKEGQEVPIPFERFRFIFVDDRPLANWHHPCRYVFVSEDMSSFSVAFAMMPPRITTKSDGSRIYLKHVRHNEPVSMDEVKKAVYQKAAEMESNAVAYPGDASHSYFVLISGGADPDFNCVRFWADTAMFYSTLTKKYNVPKDHIRVFVSDGTNTAADVNLNSQYSPLMTSSPTDLDGDGEVDVNGPATFSAVRSAFFALTNVLTSTDRLFVFVTSHGASIGTEGVSNWDSKAYLYSATGSTYDSEGNTTYFKDSELADWTENFKCPVGFAIETCYSGGFIDNIKGSATNSRPRAIATACTHYESSWGKLGYGDWGDYGEGQTSAYNCWIGQLIAAFRGYTPKTMGSLAYPWQDGNKIDADADANGRVSLLEAKDYAYDNDSTRCTKTTHTISTCNYEHPQFDEYPAGTGSAFYLVDDGTSSIPTLSSLSILGKSTILSGTASYGCTAFYTSGTNATVSPIWTVISGSDYAMISEDGIVVPADFNGCRVIVLQASYTECGVTKTATKAVTIQGKISIAEALDCTNLTFTTDSSSEWFGQTTTTYDGIDALQSGALGNNKTNWVETTVSGLGTISFYWYASSESALYDYVFFTIDGTYKAKIGGTSCSWTKCSYSVGSGQHKFRWSYRKDVSGTGGLDAGFLDQVKWTPAYRITYAPGSNGSGMTNTATKVQGVAITLKGAIFTRDGYTQTGWATSDGGSTSYALGASYVADEPITLYPVWTANSVVFPYAVVNGTAKITKYAGPVGDVNIPSTIDGYEVTSLADYLFHMSNISSVVIPDTVTNIGMFAFADCRNLTTIHIPDRVSVLGNRQYPSFGGNTSQTSFTISPSNQYFAVTNGILFTKGFGELVSYPAGKSGSYYAIPSTVTNIWGCAFDSCRYLASVSIPEGVESLRYCAFESCSALVSVSLPMSLKGIGFYVFQNCDSLKSLAIPSNVTQIGYNALQTTLTNLVLTSRCGGEYASKKWGATVANSNIWVRASDYDYWVGYFGTGISSFADQCTISFDANGGVASPSPVVASYYTAMPAITTIPSHVGYTFLGYYDQPIGGTQYYTANLKSVRNWDKVCSTATLYAHWQITTYSVVYLPGSYGSGYSRSSTKTNGVDLILLGAVFTRNNYRQIGWSTTDGGTLAYALGATYTYNAPLTLYPVWSYVSPAMALDNDTLTFTLGGSSSWYSQTSYTHDGEDAMRSGYIGNNKTNWLATTVSGPGVLSFWWKVSSEARFDILEFVVDGSVVTNISGTVNWTRIEYEISDFGEHSVQWRYRKDDSVYSGLDAGFLDQVSFVERGPLPDGGPYTNIVNGVSWVFYITNGEARIGAAGRYLRGHATVKEPVGEVTIPSYLGYAPVTAIGDYAFFVCYGLTSITIPEGITSIGKAAFEGCEELQEVTIPNTVTNISLNAFEYCIGLTAIYVDFGDESRIRGLLARSGFDSTGIRVDLADGGPYSETVDGVLWTYYITNGIARVGGGGTYASGLAIPSSYSGEITVPSRLGGCPVEQIGKYAFYNCSGLTAVTISNSVTSIGTSAFTGCNNIRSVTIPGCVTRMSLTFPSCYSSITNAVLAEGATSVANKLFYDCNALKSVTLPPTVASLGSEAFTFCGSLESVDIPYGVRSIGNYTFHWCFSLKSVTIPSSVRSIGTYAFFECQKLENVEIPSSVTTIGDWAFYACLSLERCSISENVTRIGFCAFGWCKKMIAIDVDSNNQYYSSVGGVLYDRQLKKVITCPAGLTSINMPDSVTDIGERSFVGCGGLTTLEFTNGITNISQYACYSCTNVQSLTISSSVINVGTNAFGNCKSLSTVRVDPGDEDRVRTMLTKSGFDCSLVNIVSEDPPAAPVISTAKGYSNNILIAWSAAEGAASYNVYRSTTTTRPTTPILSNITVTNYHDYQVTPGIDYYYWVEAVNTAGSAVSECASAYLGFSLTLGSYAQNFASAGGSTNVTVTANTNWVATASVSWITLDASSGVFSGTLSYSVAANAVTSSRTGTITVTAGGSTAHPVTKTITVRQDAYVIPKPSAPTISAVSTDNTSYVILIWGGAVAGATSYNVYRSTSATRPVTAYATGFTDSWYYDQKAVPGVTYHYWVEAVNSSGSAVSASGSGYRAVSLSLSSSAQSFVAGGGSASATVIANTDWSASSNVSWIRLATSSGSSMGSVSFVVEKNTAATARAGKIAIVAGGTSDHPKTVVLTITQAASEVALPNLTFAVFGNWQSHGHPLFTSLSNTGMPVRVIERGTRFSVMHGFGNLGDGVAVGPFNNCIVIADENGAVLTNTVEFSDSYEKDCGATHGWRDNAWTNYPAGLYSVRVTIDSDNDVEETDEGDNEHSYLFAISDPVSLNDALDSTNLTFTTGGKDDWYGTKGYGSDGVDCVAAHHKGDDATNDLMAAVSGPVLLSFNWKVSSQADHDELQFMIDGEVKKSISGTGGAWTNCQFSIPFGNHQLTWRYVKDSSSYSGFDCGWIDQVSLAETQPPAAPVISRSSAYSTNIQLFWEAVEGATSYNVYRSTTTTRPAVPIVSGLTDVSYTDKSAYPGVDCYYWVEAVNPAGSAVSECVSNYRRIQLTVYPSTHSFVSAGGSTNVTVTANTNWVATVSASWITLAATSGVSRGTLSYSVAANAATVSRTGTITVTAGGSTAHPVTKTITVKQAAATSGGDIPTAPSSLVAVSANSVELSWIAVEGAMSYTVWRSATANSESATKIATVSATSYSDASATAFTTSYYWVKAVVSGCESDFSPVASGYRYEANTHFLKYDANGGVGTMTNEIRSTTNGKSLTRNAFTRSGYAFMGWARNKSSSETYTYLDQQYVTVTNVAGSSVTLYAAWAKCDERGLVIRGNVLQRWANVGITDIVIPEGVTKVNVYALTDAEITSVVFPDSLKEVYGYAFADCLRLTNVVCGAGLVKLYNAAFKGCKSLETVTLSHNLKEIGTSVFYGTDLKKLDIPASVTNIDRLALGSCSSLTNLTLWGRIDTKYASNKWGSGLANSKVWVRQADAEYWQAAFGTGFNILEPSIGSVDKIVGEAGVSYRMKTDGGDSFVIAESWFASAGVDISGGVTPSLMNGTGANGLPRYQSYLFGLEPESTVPAEEQLKTIITFDDAGKPIISCDPKSDNALVGYTTVGKSSLGSTEWVEVTDANRSTMRFFKVKVNVK